MAPFFEPLREADLDDSDFDEDEVDISDLRDKYEVQLEQGFDSFVVVDGLPSVTEEQRPKLVKFLLKKMNQVGKTKEDKIEMPMGDDGKSLRFVSLCLVKVTLQLLICALLDLLSSSTHPLPRPPRQSGNSTLYPSTRTTRSV